MRSGCARDGGGSFVTFAASVPAVPDSAPRVRRRGTDDVSGRTYGPPEVRVQFDELPDESVIERHAASLAGALESRRHSPDNAIRTFVTSFCLWLAAVSPDRRSAAARLRGAWTIPFQKRDIAARRRASRTLRRTRSSAWAAPSHRLARPARCRHRRQRSRVPSGYVPFFFRLVGSISIRLAVSSGFNAFVLNWPEW